MDIIISFCIGAFFGFFIGIILGIAGDEDE